MQEGNLGIAENGRSNSSTKPVDKPSKKGEGPWAKPGRRIYQENRSDLSSDREMGWGERTEELG